MFISPGTAICAQKPALAFDEAAKCRENYAADDLCALMLRKERRYARFCPGETMLMPPVPAPYLILIEAR